MDKNIHLEVQNYYGNILDTSGDIKTSNCCSPISIPEQYKSNMAKIHSEVMSKFYGCGIVIPEVLEGTRILDLGSGSGRDVYLLSQLVGENGEVVGVDMTDEQLEIANKHIDFHTKQFGYKTSNVKFVKGFIEKLDELGFEENYFDIIISNCVINLSPDKQTVFNSAYKLLKSGGEMYFSDIYADRRLPEHLIKDPVLYGECLSGALYWNDFLRMAIKAGFTDPRLVTDYKLTIESPEAKKKLEGFVFYSATFRLFKIENLESSCEDYGQAVIYKGTIPYSPIHFALDAHHKIEKGKVFPVCGNTYRMLNETRFNEHFEFIGKWDTHYGIFTGCEEQIPFASFENNTSSGCC